MKGETNKIVLLFSGGIDSTVLLYRLLSEGKSVYPLYVDYGQITSKGELKSIQSILSDCDMSKRLFQLNVRDVARIGAGTLIGEYPKDKYNLNEWYESEFFPNRNIMLLTLATMYCYKISAKYVAIGVTGERSYADTSMEFIAHADILFSQILGDIKVYAPYANESRRTLLEDGMRFRVPFDKTFSCNVYGDHHCLFCTSCNDREIAMRYIRENGEICESV